MGFSIPIDVQVIAGLFVLVVVFGFVAFAKLFRKAGPHEALVVYGLRGTRIIKGKGTIIIPMIETARGLSLELMSFDVAPKQDLYTKQGVAVTVEAVAQIKVKSDTESIMTASEQFLTKDPVQREGLIKLVMEGHLRGIIGQLTVEEIVKQPEMVSDRMRSTCAEDMNKMGLEVISFTIKEVRDQNEYITNMGRPDIARIKRDADVATAEAERDTAMRRAIATREAAVATAQADQERVLAQALSLTKQAEAQRDLDVKKAEYAESVKKQQATADKSYEIQTNIMQQQLVVEAVKVQKVEREQQVMVQEAEILRREKELIATVLKPAEIERQRIETLAGAKERYKIITPEIEERINFELFTIKTMGFAGYFLIVSDFIIAGKNMGVFVGPGRGSAAGSVVAYCIGITNIDPIKYNLLFERFLNPDRKSMPDIDTDFDDEGRQKVLNYVVDKYGKNQVAQIITYGTMAAKMSIKDVARVMDLPLAESNALAKLIPDRPGTSLRRVLKAPMTGLKSLSEEGTGADDLDNIKKLRDIYNGEDMRSKVLHEAEILEGSVRNTGIHASAIIIAPQDLMELIPVATSKDSDLWLTQIDGSNIESAGVLKMDFLGLKTLSILKTALQLIKQNHGIDIDLDTLPLDDVETYKLYQRADTNATFQFESGGMQKYLRDLKPDTFNDLIAMNALYRPGPMAYIPDYIERKHGRQEIHYDLPEMEEILKDTYGITVYQEQVMLLSQKIGGFSKGDADVLRKAMGKKQRSVLDKMKAQFIEGAKKNNHSVNKLEKIWTDWESFAQYAFNKSHSTCYALVAYQTAYLKAHYPSEYMAAVLNHAGSIEKITFYMEECKRMGLTVLGPDINESQKGFAVNKKGEIRFGFSGMKGVGEAAFENIIEEREKFGAFSSIYNLIKRVNQRTVNKKSLESLAYAGAFDCFKTIHRAQYFFVAPGDTINGLEKVIRFGNQYQAQLSNSTNTLFGDLQMEEVKAPPMAECEPWPLIKLLDFEKEVTGMFMSGHPLDNFSFQLKHYGLTPIAEFNEFKEAVNLHPNPGRTFRIAGLVAEAQHRIAKSGNKYGVFHIEDYTAKMELMLFSDDYVKFSNYLEAGMVIFLTGTFRQRYNKSEFEFKVNQISLMESLMKSCTRKLQIELAPENVSGEFIDFITENVRQFPGNSSLKFCINDSKSHLRVGMYTLEKGFEMNDEMATYLQQKPELDVQVELT